MEIYLVTNTINGKQYIGKTTRLLKKRKWEHHYDANKNSSYYFHRALRKYGFDAFLWESIFKTDDVTILGQKEIECISKFGSYICGYNLTNGEEGYHKDKSKIIKDLSYDKKLKLSLSQWGECSRTVKITEKDVRSIIVQLLNGISGRSLADEYGLCIQSIYDIQYRRTWKYIKLSKKLEQKLLEVKSDISYNLCCKLSIKEVKETKDLIKNTLFSNKEISMFYNVNRRTIYDIRYNTTWKSV